MSYELESCPFCGVADTIMEESDASANAMEADGALVCALVGRGNGKTQRMANAFCAWLESEADHG